MSTPTSTPTPRAVIDAATGGVLDEITVEATAEGYAVLVEFAQQPSDVAGWAIEGPEVTAPA